MRPKIPFRQPARQGNSSAQQAGTHTFAVYVHPVQGSTTQMQTCTGGGGGQQTTTGSQQGAGPQCDAEAVLGAKAENATKEAATINGPANRNMLNSLLKDHRETHGSIPQEILADDTSAKNFNPPGVFSVRFRTQPGLGMTHNSPSLACR